jgi:hypothetical protein
VIDNNIIEGTVKDEGGGIIIDTIIFEWDKPLEVKEVMSKNGGLEICFNRVGKVSIGDGSSLMIIIGSDVATNIVKRAEISEVNNHICWLPATPPKAGTYNLLIEGFVDEYGNKSLLFQKPIKFL